MALMVWKMSTSPSTLTLSTSHIAAMNTPVRDMPSLTKEESAQQSAQLYPSISNIIYNYAYISNIYYIYNQYIKLTISPDCSVELVGIHQLTVDLIPRIDLQAHSIPSQPRYDEFFVYAHGKNSADFLAVGKNTCHYTLSNFMINACHIYIYIKYTLIYIANVEEVLGIITSKQTIQPVSYSLPIASNSSNAIYSLAHDKGSFVLFLTNFLHFPHHFQKRQCFWIAISRPLLEVKCSNFQTSRRALRGVSPHISLVERYWSTKKASEVLTFCDMHDTNVPFTYAGTYTMHYLDCNIYPNSCFPLNNIGYNSV